MRKEGIDFQQCSNAFLKCANPARLQELADSLTPRDLLQCGQKWLATFTPFISDWERKQAGCRQLFHKYSLVVIKLELRTAEQRRNCIACDWRILPRPIDGTETPPLSIRTRWGIRNDCGLPVATGVRS